MVLGSSAGQGRITAVEVAAESPVPLAQASELLEAMSRSGACRMSVAEAGLLVFELPGFAAEAKPETASEADKPALARAAGLRNQRKQ